MVDIIPETINRIRLSNDELILLKKMDEENLTDEEREFYKILVNRVEVRLKLKKEDKKFKNG